jgi:hypothetical protein
VRECLDAIRADTIAWRLRNPVQWRECLQFALLYSREPTLVAYLEDWARADATRPTCAPRCSMCERSAIAALLDV